MRRKNSKQKKLINKKYKNQRTIQNRNKKTKINEKAMEINLFSFILTSMSVNLVFCGAFLFSVKFGMMFISAIDHELLIYSFVYGNF